MILDLQIAEGYAALIDDFGNEVCEHYDRKMWNAYADALRNGQSVARWFFFLRDLALAEQYIVNLEGNWLARGAASVDHPYPKGECLYRRVIPAD